MYKGMSEIFILTFGKFILLIKLMHNIYLYTYIYIYIYIYIHFLWSLSMWSKYHKTPSYIILGYYYVILLIITLPSHWAIPEKIQINRAASRGAEYNLKKNKLQF